MPEAWTDFVSDFMALTEGASSPELFRRWAAISLVGGALERRVWVKTGQYTTFCNLYTLLVAPPGVGKFIIEDVRQLWTETRETGTRNSAFHVAPDSMTKASLVDTLAKAKTTRLAPKGQPLVYHSLLVGAEEFSVLLPAYDMEYIGVLNSIFNNKAVYEESRRHGPVKELKIEFPQLNLLGGAQPAWLGSMFPDEAWSSGLARRIIMVYSSEGPLQDIFFEPEIDPDARVKLVSRLSQFSAMFGQIEWSPEASDKFRRWHLAGGPPQPAHSKLVDYCRTRSQFIIKLAGISTISRSGGRIIEAVDLARALEWLLDVERVMPDIFRAMIGKSDTQIIEDLHYFITAMWNKEKRNPVNGEAIRRFLLQRVPHDKVESLIMAAERANIIARSAGTQDLWVPRPRHEHGIE